MISRPHTKQFRIDFMSISLDDNSPPLLSNTSNSIHTHGFQVALDCTMKTLNRNSKDQEPKKDEPSEYEIERTIELSQEEEFPSKIDQ